jgi:hypothetical protein
MRYLLLAFSFFLFSTAAQAQQPGVSADAIRAVIEQAQARSGGRVQLNTQTFVAALAMHGCLKEKIGDAGMQRLGQWGTALNKQTKPLCAAGKRDEAFALQQRYAKSVMKTAEYRGVKACTAQYKDLMNDPVFTEIRAVVEQPDAARTHVCDYQKRS